MENTEYTKGQRVYTRHGQEGEYVGMLDGRHAVRPVEIYGDGEESLGEITFWDDVFTTPPTEKLHSEIVVLEAKQQELRDSISQKQKIASQMDQIMEARSKLFARHEKLAILEDFLEGRVTHYVVFPEYGGDVTIVSVEATEGEYSRDRLRLVSISGLIKNGRKGKTIEWNLHSYADGSGHGKNSITPCVSHEAAKEVIRKFLDQQFQNWRDRDDKDGAGKKPIGHLEGYIKCAERYDFQVPQDVIDAVIEYRRFYARKAIEDAEKKLQLAKDQLAVIGEQ